MVKLCYTQVMRMVNNASVYRYTFIFYFRIFIFIKYSNGTRLRSTLLLTNKIYRNRFASKFGLFSGIEIPLFEKVKCLLSYRLQPKQLFPIE